MFKLLLPAFRTQIAVSRYVQIKSGASSLLVGPFLVGYKAKVKSTPNRSTQEQQQPPTTSATAAATNENKKMKQRNGNRVSNTASKTATNDWTTDWGRRQQQRCRIHVEPRNSYRLQQHRVTAIRLWPASLYSNNFCGEDRSSGSDSSSNWSSVVKFCSLQITATVTATAGAAVALTAIDQQQRRDDPLSALSLCVCLL